jgi:hypothetical protein
LKVATSEFAFNTVLVRQKCASLKDSDGGGVLTGWQNLPAPLQLAFGACFPNFI